MVGLDGAGILVPPGDAGALAAGIRAVLDDPRRAEQMRRAARERVEARFTWRAAALGCVDNYRKVIAGC